jgi:hypothetical protein
MHARQSCYRSTTMGHVVRTSTVVCVPRIQYCENVNTYFSKIVSSYWNVTITVHLLSHYILWKKVGLHVLFRKIIMHVRLLNLHGGAGTFPARPVLFPIDRMHVLAVVCRSVSAVDEPVAFSFLPLCVRSVTGTDTHM